MQERRIIDQNLNEIQLGMKELEIRYEQYFAGIEKREPQRDRVALAMTNCPQYLEVRYAAWWAGLIAVPMNAKLHSTEFNCLLADSGARAVFATPDLMAAIAPLLDELDAQTLIV